MVSSFNSEHDFLHFLNVETSVDRTTTEVERGGMKTCVLSERRGLCSFVNSRQNT